MLFTSVSTRLRAWLHEGAGHAVRHDGQWAASLATVAIVGAMTGLVVEAAAQVRSGEGFAATIAASLTGAAVTPAVASEPRPVVVRWIGRDIDGDGAADFTNPTGGKVRGFDDYGFGHYGASRDGGSRRHAGLDYVAAAGQRVLAPLSGYVTRIGYTYAGDTDLRYVEIRNPALRYKARVFYVDPSVDVGQTVRLGDTVGRAHTLQERYGGGMTDHVHLELTGPDGEKLDPNDVIVPHVEVVRALG